MQWSTQPGSQFNAATSCFPSRTACASSSIAAPSTTVQIHRIASLARTRWHDRRFKECWWEAVSGQCQLVVGSFSDFVDYQGGGFGILGTLRLSRLSREWASKDIDTNLQHALAFHSLDLRVYI